MFRKTLIRLALFLLGCALGLCIVFPSFAEEDPGDHANMNADDEKHDIGGVNIPNPKPILTTQLVPGFDMVYSELHVFRSLRPGEVFVSEEWAQSQSGSATRPTFVQLTLYLNIKNQAEAFQAAKMRYGATSPDSPRQFLDVPTTGSFSGNPIGDHCWAYTRVHEEPRNCSTLVVIQGRNLFNLSVANADLPANDSAAESLAQAIITRLKQWPRPNLRDLPDLRQVNGLDDDMLGNRADDNL